MRLQWRGMGKIPLDDVNSVCIHVRRSPDPDSTFILLFGSWYVGVCRDGLFEVTDLKTDLALIRPWFSRVLGENLICTSILDTRYSKFNTPYSIYSILILILHAYTPYSIENCDSAMFPHREWRQICQGMADPVCEYKTTSTLFSWTKVEKNARKCRKIGEKKKGKQKKTTELFYTLFQQKIQYSNCYRRCHDRNYA